MPTSLLATPARRDPRRTSVVLVGLLGLGTVIGAVLVRAPAAGAQAIIDLVVSTSPSGDAQVHFPESTRSVWVRFDYIEASFTSLELTLVSPSGVLMFSREQEFEGAGTEAWEVTGDAVARGLASRLAQAALTAQDSARRAATQQHGVAEYLGATAYAVGQMRSTSGLLLELPLDSNMRGMLTRTSDAARAMTDLLVEANSLPTDDIAGRQEYARQMAEPAGRAVTESGSFAAALEATSGLPMPPTRSATRENDAHTVAIRVNGSAARTASIWFFDGQVYLPSVRTLRR